MSSKKASLGRSLAFRLTVMYAGVCAASLLVVLAAAYLVLQSTLQRRLDQALANEIQEYGGLLETQDIDVLRDVLKREAESEGTDKVFFRILDPAGNAVVATDLRAWSGLESRSPHLLAASEGRTVFETLLLADQAYPARIVYGRVGPSLILQLGESTEGNVEVLRHFKGVFVAATLAFVACSLLIGILMARRALSGVQRVTQTARDIAAGAWDSRVPLSSWDDEIDELADAFNHMVERIQVLIRELREVSDDIAHDLRTPITRMRAAAEIALRESEDCPDRQELTGSILEECDQLLGLINTMLEISQTEAGAKPLDRERLDLSALAEDVFDLFRPAAEDKGLTVAFSGAGGVWIDGDASKLKRAIAHVLDNAVKYTGPGGRIDVACHDEGAFVFVTIADTGVGISEKALDKLFTRFYRGDQSRTQSGNGLGLSLARAVCRAHGGDVSVTSVLGEGSAFRLSVPGL